MAGRPAKPARRGEIVDVACRLFRKRGYHGTSMDDVADAVGLNKGTIYHYFDGKASLLHQMYLDSTEAVLECIQVTRVDVCASEMLRTFIAQNVALGTSSPDRTAVYFQESPFLKEWLSPEQVETIQSRERQVRLFVTFVLDKGVREGIFDPMDTHIMALGVMSSLSALYRWYRIGGSETADRVADQIADLLLNGLATRSPVTSALPGDRPS